MPDPEVIRERLAELPFDVIMSDARSRIERLRQAGNPLAGSAEAHIAGHRPDDQTAACSPCVECEKDWPCPAITLPWALTDYG